MTTPISTLQTLAYDVNGATVAAFDGSSLQWEYASENLQMVQAHGNTNGMRGTRSRTKDRRRILSESIGGQLVLNPTPVELDTILPLILGAAEVTNTFDLADTLPSFGLLLDRITARFVYTEMVVNRATFAGSQGGFITLTLDLLGKTEVVDYSTVFPVTVPAIDSGQPYVFGDVDYVLAADATAVEVQAFSVTIDNALDPNHFYNSITRTQINPTDRIVAVDMVLSFDADTKDAYDQAVTGGNGTLTLDSGTPQTLFTFANLGVPAVSPVGGGRGNEILLNLSMVAEMSGATNELVVTHASS